MLPDVFYGEMESPRDFRLRQGEFNDRDEDDLLDPTPPDVVQLLGFDPLDAFDIVEKFDPYHDRHGEFTSSGGATGVLSQMKGVLEKSGLRMGQVSELSPGVVESLHIKPAQPTKWHQAAVEGVASAMASLSSKSDVFKNLSDTIKTSVQIVPASYEPAGAAMTTVTEKGKTTLLLNTAYDPSTTGTGNAFAFSAQEAQKVANAGGSKEEQIKTEFRYNTYHEFGHVLDKATGGQLSAIMGNLVAQSFPDSATGIEWLKKNLSGYAATSVKDATAEAVSILLGTGKLPAKLDSFKEALV